MACLTDVVFVRSPRLLYSRLTLASIIERPRCMSSLSSLKLASFVPDARDYRSCRLGAGKRG